MEKSGVPQRTQSMRHDRSDWSAAITLLTAALLVAATSLVWFSVRKSHDNHIMEQARSEIENFAARLDAHVKLRISLGALIGEEWRNGLISDVNTFRFHAATKLNYFNDLQAINWVDPEGVIRWVNPIEGNAAALNLDLRRLKIPAEILAMSEQKKAVQITPPITLAQGGRGFCRLYADFHGWCAERLYKYRFSYGAHDHKCAAKKLFNTHAYTHHG